jgi:Fur family transcriptional regulator, stress-responsive regulator
MPQGDVAVHRQLREVGLRITGPRRAVLVWPADHPHPTADEVGSGVREHIRSVSIHAVDDVLVTRAEVEISSGGSARLATPPVTNAASATTTTRSAASVTGSGTSTLLSAPDPARHPPGYDLDQAEVVLWGMRPDSSGAAVSGDTAVTDQPVVEAP